MKIDSFSKFGRPSQTLVQDGAFSQFRALSQVRALFQGGIRSACCALLCLFSTSLYSHEYWLSPIDYHIEVGEKLIVDIRNGEEFVGSSFPFDATQYKSLYIVHNGAKSPLISRLGDYPAIHKILSEPGQYTVALESTERLLTYESWEKFSNFLSYHGLEAFKKQHEELGFPKNVVKEHYYRYAKSLIQVTGDAEANAERDSNESLEVHGQEFEIVLLDNPYSGKTDITLQLLFQGEPLPDRQVEVFHKGESITRSTTKTDSNGKATISVLEKGEYMINAVKLVASDRSNMHWKSLWSSFTFYRM